MKKLFLLFWVSLFFQLSADAQVLRRLERKVQQKLENKADQAIDKGLNKIEEDMEGKNKKDKKPAKGNEQQDAPVEENAPSPAAKEGGFSATSKFDFVPGDKVLVVEDFSQDAVGDFPVKWNTDASGEIVTLEGSDGKWLALTTRGVVTPEFITDLPDNFTMEFDLAVNPAYDYYDTPLEIGLLETNAPKNSPLKWFASNGKSSGYKFTLHPQDAGSPRRGRTGFDCWMAGEKITSNNRGQLEAFSKDNNTVHVAIWRQNQRIRVYVGETKVWDLPRAFSATAKYNAVTFSRGSAKEGNMYYISNLRLAVGNPDTRNKLITEGKFTTTGIYFNTGSAVIKSESHGVIKEIAAVLKENPSVSIQIVGHTDSDGSDEANLKLSKARAEAVKKYLQGTFSIEASRMTTDGKGEAQPVGGNDTPEGKAANRRVEFIKQ